MFNYAKVMEMVMEIQAIIVSVLISSFNHCSNMYPRGTTVISYIELIEMP